MASSPLVLDDYWNLRFLTDMRLSTDGRFIAYVAQSADREANEIRSAIWLLDARSGEQRQRVPPRHRSTFHPHLSFAPIAMGRHGLAAG